MSGDADKVYSTGLTFAEAEELHKHLIEGTRSFGAIALLAHVLAFAFSPWLH
jgi:light-harvesting protein B-800-850 beta chain